jgi:hypothetical protein
MPRNVGTPARKPGIPDRAMKPDRAIKLFFERPWIASLVAVLILYLGLVFAGDTHTRSKCGSGK